MIAAIALQAALVLTPHHVIRAPDTPAPQPSALHQEIALRLYQPLSRYEMMRPQATDPCVFERVRKDGSRVCFATKSTGAAFLAQVDAAEAAAKPGDCIVKDADGTCLAVKK